jgi:hypothetical protein
MLCPILCLGDARHHLTLWKILLGWHDRGRYSRLDEAVGEDPRKHSIHTTVPSPIDLSRDQIILHSPLAFQGRYSRWRRPEAPGLQHPQGNPQNIQLTSIEHAERFVLVLASGTAPALPRDPSNFERNTHDVVGNTLYIKGNICVPLHDNALGIICSQVPRYSIRVWRTDSAFD